MPTLLEQVATSAASRLGRPIPRNSDGPRDLSGPGEFLRVEGQRLRAAHRKGAGGVEVCRARAALVDSLGSFFWEGELLSAGAPARGGTLALVALGGYGRGELNPESDLDLMFLHSGQVAGTKPLPILTRLMDAVLYPFWDLGFRLGHSVRTVAECVELANRDMQSKTALLEARLIVGDASLFEELQKMLLAKCVRRHEDEYIAARLQDQAARHAKFGNSPTMQEPNIKNGCGGLRDFHNLHWMAYVKYGTRSLQEMEAQELITSAERGQLESACDFLLRARTELHYQLNRPGDVLMRHLQPVVAAELGYTERGPRLRLERFMSDLYTHSRRIYLVCRTVEDRLALLPANDTLPKLRRMLGAPFKSPPQIVDGFKFAEGKIHLASPRAFHDQPRRLMRVFLYAQQRGLMLHPEVSQRIRNELSLVDREFLNDAHVRDTFLEILSQRGDVSRILHAMHEAGLLGAYIPEFGKLTCLVQHEFYHQYTADEHTLMCLEQLERLWKTDAPPHKKYAEVLKTVERPLVLHLALLLHDSGKAVGTGNHCDVSSELSSRVARRLGLDGATSHSLRLLIELHLSMVQVSQRRDLDDPAVINGFARQAQTAENLRMLVLHTFVDAQATSDRLWNDFKDSLLWELFQKCLRVLLGERRSEEMQRGLLADEVKRELSGPVSLEEVDAHFASSPSRYFEITDVEEIKEDLSLVHRFLRSQVAEEDNGLAPVISWKQEPDRGYTRVKVCTWDRAGLFSNIAGSFSASGLNILSAQVFTRTDAIVLDSFFVTDARTGNLANREQQQEFEKVLGGALTGREVDFPALIARHRIPRPTYQSLEGDAMPTRVSFDNETSNGCTIIDLETEDRLGLLYQVSQVLSGLHLDISLAKVTTERGAAIDSFYVTRRGGKKITSAADQKAIESRLQLALNR